MTGLGTVVRVELARVRAQWRLRLAALLALAGPPLVTLVLQAQTGLPTDTLYGRWVQEIGLAVPLVLLGSVGLFGLPLLAALVGGEILSTEDQHGTWATLLTRSTTARTLVAAKVLVAVAATLLLTAVLAVSCVLSGVLIVGTQDLVGLGGQPIGFGAAAWLVAGSWLVVVPTAVAFTALALLSGGVTRSSAVGVGAPLVLALALHVTSLLGSLGGLRVALLVPGLEAWHGLLLEQRSLAPALASAAVASVWTAAALAGLWLVLRRRDLAVP